MTTGIIDRFRTMPIRSGAVLTGHVVASLARNLVATAVVIAVALLVGFRPVATPLEWVAVRGVVPVETMPEWLQPIAECQPITPVIETIRALLMDAPLGDSAWWAIGWCVAIIAVSVVWGAWLFRRKAGRR
ncbi:ABC transporter permease [Agromyces bauzanensis]|uniref:Uncharacterized protein n=1 Tax=Agromyces bauzanensis TaxID=1308924 RepID=A0A917UNE7_9MICO|nr:ABC transporter permease [Agromyces bauzanensis]GGJ70413.1 hypothetical protein GCM10011372_05370 [Agromyces bauzanensis]